MKWKKANKEILVVIGLSSLFAFTLYGVLTLIGMWILPNSQVCWHEPNTVIRTSEIFLGILGMSFWVYLVKIMRFEK